MLGGEHAFWYLTRASGFVAFLLLFATLAFGMLMPTNLVGTRMPRNRVYDLHNFLTVLALGFTVFYLLIVLPDGYIGFSLSELLIPFSSPYQPLFMALGTPSFYLLLAVIGSFYLRNLVGYRAWRLFHYLTFVLLLMAYGHAIGAGSDSAKIWAQEIYLLSAILLCGLATIRVFERSKRAFAHPRHRQRPARSKYPAAERFHRRTNRPVL